MAVGFFRSKFRKSNSAVPENSVRAVANPPGSETGATTSPSLLAEVDSPPLKNAGCVAPRPIQGGCPSKDSPDFCPTNGDPPKGWTRLFVGNRLNLRRPSVFSATTKSQNSNIQCDEDSGSLARRSGTVLKANGSFFGILKRNKVAAGSPKNSSIRWGRALSTAKAPSHLPRNATPRNGTEPPSPLPVIESSETTMAKLFYDGQHSIPQKEAEVIRNKLSAPCLSPRTQHLRSTRAARSIFRQGLDTAWREKRHSNNRGQGNVFPNYILYQYDLIPDIEAISDVDWTEEGSQTVITEQPIPKVISYYVKICSHKYCRIVHRLASLCQLFCHRSLPLNELLSPHLDHWKLKRLPNAVLNTVILMDLTRDAYQMSLLPWASDRM